MPKRVECRIYGRVQGVFFREFVKTTADGLGLLGFVRNEADGGVLIVAEGEEKKLKKFLELIRRGTKYSKIEKVDVRWFTPSKVEGQNLAGEFSSFEIKF